MFLLALVLAASGPNPFLAEARVHYQALEYARCLKRLDQASVWKSALEEEAEVALYRGLCHFGQGEEALTRSDFELALRISPAVALPPYSSPRLRELFEEVRKRSAPPEPVAPPVAPEPLPAKVVEPPVVSAPVVSAPVQEVRAEKRHSIVPWIAGGAAVAAGGLGVGFGLHAKSLESQSRRTTFEADTRQAAEGSRASATRANISYAVAGVALGTAATLWLVDHWSNR